MVVCDLPLPSVAVVGGISIVAVCQLPKLKARVRFSYPAPVKASLILAVFLLTPKKNQNSYKQKTTIINHGSIDGLVSLCSVEFKVLFTISSAASQQRPFLL